MSDPERLYGFMKQPDEPLTKLGKNVGVPTDLLQRGLEIEKIGTLIGRMGVNPEFVKNLVAQLGQEKVEEMGLLQMPTKPMWIARVEADRWHITVGELTYYGDRETLTQLIHDGESKEIHTGPSNN